MLFKVYSKGLATHSGAFPFTENVKSLSNKVVPLPESADVLELLFQCTRRQRQPNLKQIKFSPLSALAEAVEKYEVYSATEVCKAHMTCVLFLHTFPKTFQPPINRAAISEHPLDVLGYATEHGYADVNDLVGPLTLNFLGQLVQSHLSPHGLLAWV
jgi:hypothetical protein